MSTLGPLLTVAITSEATALAFLRAVATGAAGWHPEESADDLIVIATGEATFTPMGAALVDIRMAEVYSYIADPCTVLLDFYLLAEGAPCTS